VTGMDLVRCCRQSGGSHARLMTRFSPVPCYGHPMGIQLYATQYTKHIIQIIQYDTVFLNLTQHIRRMTRN
jgi:hypothetical protein